MKKLIINSGQLSRLCEDSGVTNDMPTIDVVADSMSNIPDLGKETADKISDSGADMAKVRVLQKGTNPIDALEVSGKKKNADVKGNLQDAMDSAESSGMDNKTVAYTAIIGPDGLPLGEGVSFKKSQIKEAVRRTLNENGIRMSKRDLVKFLLK